MKKNSFKYLLILLNDFYNNNFNQMVTSETLSWQQQRQSISWLENVRTTVIVLLVDSEKTSFRQWASRQLWKMIMKNFFFKWNPTLIANSLSLSLSLATKNKFSQNKPDIRSLETHKYDSNMLNCSLNEQMTMSKSNLICPGRFSV